MGYARASGRVGVAMATSGPGATNMVTGLATAMLDSIPIVCITGNVSSKVLGSDAFQEVDITGITLPITKHNYLVTRAEDIAAAVRDGISCRCVGAAGAGADRHYEGRAAATADFDFAAAAPKQHKKHPMLRAERSGIADAAKLILEAKRPVVLAGYGIIKSGAGEQVRTLAERAGTAGRLYPARVGLAFRHHMN